MKYAKSIGWFLLDSATGVVRFFAYLSKKIIKAARSFFGSEYFRRNKKTVVTCSVFILAVLFLAGYVFQKYTIVVIPRDEQQQSAAEKKYFDTLKGITMEPAKDRSSERREPGPRPRVVPLRGKVRNVQGDNLTIVTEREKEEEVILTEETKIFPPSNEMAVGQDITAYGWNENGGFVAERVFVRKALIVEPRKKEDSSEKNTVQPE